MKYDFDTVTDRRGTNSLKWNVTEGELPMWVADMDFKAAPEILSAIQKRAEHGIFGYTIVPDEWYQAYIAWWERRHDFVMDKEWLLFCQGVMPAISSIIRRMTAPGEKVLIQTPVYNGFFHVIEASGRQVIENPLKYEEGEYSVDFEDLDKKLANPQTTLMILCNPHNPAGKIWDRETLERVGDLCQKHQTLVLADEIHCDLTDPGCRYVPFASISDKCRENSITCIAPTKAFNIAGLQSAAVAVADKVLRDKVKRGFMADGFGEPNAFAVEAAVAAFTKGGDWLDELREYVYGNKKLAVTFIKEQIPQISVTPSKATYLLWLDCRRAVGDMPKPSRLLRERTGLYLSEGKIFGSNGKGFFRMNIACPRKALEDGLNRLKEGLVC